jgi:hypothetical protein
MMLGIDSGVEMQSVTSEVVPLASPHLGHQCGAIQIMLWEHVLSAAAKRSARELNML